MVDGSFIFIEGFIRKIFLTTGSLYVICVYLNKILNLWFLFSFCWLSKALRLLSASGIINYRSYVLWSYTISSRFFLIFFIITKGLVIFSNFDRTSQIFEWLALVLRIFKGLRKLDYKVVSKRYLTCFFIKKI